MNGDARGKIMNDEVIAAFRKSASGVFQMMLGLEVTSGEVKETDQLLARYDVSGIIGLTGGMSGDVIVSFDERVAILATGALLGEQPAELDNDVVDAVGELTNMIAGAAKGSLESYDMSLALPTVILGSGHRIGFKSGIRPISMPFASQWGDFSVDLGLTDVAAPSFVG